MRNLAAGLISWGPHGILLLAVLDSAGVPLPTGVDLAIVSLASVKPAAAYLTALLALIGSVIGCMILFWIARKGGEAYLERHSLTPRARKFRVWFQRYGLLTVFIPALVPIPLPMKLFVISAGALGVRPHAFLFIVVLARIPRYAGLAYLGRSISGDPKAWLGAHVLHLAAFAVALFAFLMLLIKISDRFRKVVIKLDQ